MTTATTTTTSQICPCGSGQGLKACCEPLIKGTKAAPTPEAVMRSRYTAYVTGDVAYLKETYLPANREDFDEDAVRKWSQSSEWLGLEILATSGESSADRGVVEFVARYKIEGQEQKHHEIADFKKQDGRWYFVDGRPPKTAPLKRDAAKANRNDPCPCGSGKKYKKCCGA